MPRPRYAGSTHMKINAVHENAVGGSSKQLSLVLLLLCSSSLKSCETVDASKVNGGPGTVVMPNGPTFHSAGVSFSSNLAEA